MEEAYRLLSGTQQGRNNSYNLNWFTTNIVNTLRHNPLYNMLTTSSITGNAFNNAISYSDITKIVMDYYTANVATWLAQGAKQTALVPLASSGSEMKTPRQLPVCTNCNKSTSVRRSN